jgi:hypothetical protein
MTVSLGTSSIDGEFSKPNIHLDKFDINNIVIPSELINGKVIDTIKPIDVKTPKWREIKLETCVDSDSNELVDDEIFIKRHELYELKERYHQLYKKIVCSKDVNEKVDVNDHTKRRRRSASISLAPNTANLNDTSKKNSLEKLKDLVQKLEKQHNTKKSNNSLNTIKDNTKVTSASSIMLNTNFDDNYNGKLTNLIHFNRF